jgi:hypothetical protein
MRDTGHKSGPIILIMENCLETGLVQQARFLDCKR